MGGSKRGAMPSAQNERKRSTACVPGDGVEEGAEITGGYGRREPMPAHGDQWWRSKYPAGHSWVGLPTILSVLTAACS